MGDGKWRMEDGGWKMEDGKWKVRSPPWRVSRQIEKGRVKTSNDKFPKTNFKKKRKMLCHFINTTVTNKPDNNTITNSITYLRGKNDKAFL